MLASSRGHTLQGLACPGKSQAVPWARRDQLLGRVKAIVQQSERLSSEAVTRSATTDKNTTDYSYTASVDVITYTAPEATHDKALKLLIDFGEHAREFISAETGLKFLELLADEQQLAAQLQRSFDPDDASRVQQLLRCCVDMRVRTQCSTQV